MIVCHCKGKTNRDIEAAAASGARTTEQVAVACEAGSCCGGCTPAIAALLRNQRTRKNTPQTPRPRR